MGAPQVDETELPRALVKAGKNLLKPHSSTKALLDRLNEAETELSLVEQDPVEAVKNALVPSMKALVSANLLRNRDSDVRVYVVSCLTEIMRITAPEAPYDDDQMKEIFRVTVEAFGKLADASCPSYKKAVAVLDTVSRVRSSLVMLDLECDDLILKMFRQFLKTIRPNHPEPVLLSMETIMVTVLDESEEVSMDLLEILLDTVKKESQDVSPMASWLVEKVLISCASKLQPCIMEALTSTETSVHIYSPVVLAICQGEAEAYIVVKPKQIEADEKITDEQVPSDSLQGKLDLGLSRKGIRSKRSAKGGTGASGDDKVRDGNHLKKLLKQVQSESTDAETEAGSTRRRGRKLNSLINPEEGYLFKTSSSKKGQEKKLGDSSLGKLAAKKASLPSKVGQTNQSVVISLSPSSKARKGSRKRSRSNLEETNLDARSLATPASKKQIVKKDDPEEESDLEKPEDSIKIAKTSKKERAHNGSAKAYGKKPLAESKKDRAQDVLAKTSAKKPLAESKKDRAQDELAKTSANKPLAESKRVETSGKKLVHSESKGASMGTHIAQSSKSKKKISRAMTPSTNESEHTSKSHPKRKRTAGEEMESHESELGEELVGKRVKVWWPLDAEFYEGIIESYCSRKKRHQVSYSDGDVEDLNLKKERWKIIQDNSSTSKEEEIDLPDSTRLSDLMRRQKAKKSKNVSMNVELSISSDVRSSKKKDPVPNSTKQGKRTQGALKGVNNEPESREEQNLKSSEEQNAETGRTEKEQKVTRATHRESETDCDDKEEPATKGECSLKFGEESNAEPECKRGQQDMPDDSNAETKTDGEEVKSRSGSNGEPETDGEEQEVAKEASAEPATDGEGEKIAKELTAEPETVGGVRESVKVLNEEPQTEVQERESAKEPTAETKLIEKEDMSEEKESNRDGYTSVPENGKVENEAEEDDQRIVKEREEETDNAEVGTIPVSG